MASLDAVGMLDKVKTFNKAINYSYLSSIELENESEYRMAFDTREYALKNNKRALVNALTKQIKQYELKQVTGYINDNFSYFVKSGEAKAINYRIFDSIIRKDTKNSLIKIIKVTIAKVFHQNRERSQ